jgi:hypothetical protein
MPFIFSSSLLWAFASSVVARDSGYGLASGATLAGPENPRAVGPAASSLDIT